MSLSVEQAREWFAEDLRITGNLQSRALVDALRSIPRERFLGPGPWTIVAGEANAKPRLTEDADPRHVYHNVSVAIDASRMLFNGQPGVLAGWLDTLAIAPGDRVVHVGCGTGYYTAIAGAMTGVAGRVFAVDIDESLVDRARANLEPWPWISVARGDGRSDLPADVDVLIVNAGATHILDQWLGALSPRGRLLVPLTVSITGMPGSISKGLVFVISRADNAWITRPGAMVAIYSLIGARRDDRHTILGQAYARHPFPRVTRLRRDPHEPEARCWLHVSGACLSE